MFRPEQFVLNLQGKYYHKKYLSLRLDTKSVYICLRQGCAIFARMGHVSGSCKSTPRCLYCGKSRHSDNPRRMQKEASRFINCQCEHWANDHIGPVVKQRTIVSIATIENISIADVKNHIESGSSTSTLLKNNSNFPTLPRNRGRTFENSNRFDLLGAKESEVDSQTYAEILKPHSFPQSSRNRNASLKGRATCFDKIGLPT